MQTKSKKSSGQLVKRIKELEDMMALGKNLFKNVLNYIPDLIFIKDEKHRWIFLNDAFCNAVGQNREDLIGKTDFDLHTKEQAQIFWEKDDLVFESNETNINEESYINSKGEKRIILTSKASFTSESGKKYLIGVSHDITERKQAEDERERVIYELQEALARVKTLSGLLPICSSCKKIRDDEGYWNSLESYIEENTEAMFSHGLCMECSDELYGDKAWYIKSKNKKKT
ncbi:MAG: PAS domain S-box protein [Desulfobacter sp.]|nr:MAG: PAS domain S-box protein [Desulfobacter sp.]